MQLKKEDVTLFVFEDDLIIYVENPQKIYKNSPRTFNKWVYQVLGI